MEYMAYAYLHMIISTPHARKHSGCDSPPANVLAVSIKLLIPSNGLLVSPINLTAVIYTLYSVYGRRFVRMYVPSKFVFSTI